MSIAAKVLIESQFAPSSVAALYTTPSNTNTIIDKLTATNTDASNAHMITIFIVPVTQTSGSSNTIILAFSIAAGTTKDFTELQNQIVSAGGSIQIQASAASVITVRGCGREVS